MSLQKYGWKAIAVGTGALTGLATQRVIEFIWTAFRGSKPPKLAADRTSPWPEAVSWAVATGIGVGVARLLAVRTAAVLWEAAVHTPPPEPGLNQGAAA
jgi:hypothetical protein